MMVSKRNLLFQVVISRFHVKLWEGMIHVKSFETPIAQLEKFPTAVHLDAPLPKHQMATLPNEPFLGGQQNFGSWICWKFVELF